MDICVDFDGTVVTHEFPRIGKDIGAIPVLKRIQDKGHRLILFTMRDEKFLDYAVDYLRNRGINLYGVNRNPEQGDFTNSPKAYAQLYIDDAALGCPLVYGDSKRPYVDWKKVEQYLEDKGII